MEHSSKKEVFSEWLDSGIFLDIEAVPGGKILSLGAVFGEEKPLYARTDHTIQQVLKKVRRWARDARFLAGHNLLWHDLPMLESAGLFAGLEEVPVVDSLVVSPLAFPKNPYHRLVKNDKLVSLSKSNPVADALNSRQVLEDALLALDGEGEAAARNRYLAFAMSGGGLPGRGCAGMEALFSALGVRAPIEEEASNLLEELGSGRCCRTSLREWREAVQSEASVRLASGFLVAWLEVAGADSTLPEWVWRRFPEVLRWMRRLRSSPCTDPDCAYCRETHDAQKQLRRYFGFEDFRTDPELSGSPGVSLQHELVRRGMSDEPLLGILPTGGGKSLCFQIPALHRHYCDGSLTIVISPLQALMKDQVEGLVEKTGLHSAGALYGLLTPPERGMALEDVRLGTTGILYVSPEQLRNRTFREAIRHRQIRGWVFDEAHCLSKWGHDFRPDYLYAGRFIVELAREQGVPPPPVFCYTATAKEDVKREILDYFAAELNQELVTLDGGTERENLDYRVEESSTGALWERIHELLEVRMGEPGKLEDGRGSAVVFTATRRRAEEIAAQLRDRGWLVDFFHAGLENEEKKAVLERFMEGRLQVVVATNAFGMGVDKADIRLVIHAQVPGSLENYLQEAGRAGRDKLPAECILLFNENDLENQFGLAAASAVTQKDVSRILRAMRRMDRGKDHTLTVSAGEILEKVGGSGGGFFFERNLDELKVRTAVAILERQRFLERNENRTRVFQARALVENWEEAESKIEALNLGERQRRLWKAVMRTFLALPGGECSNIDVFAQLPEMKEVYREEKERMGEGVSLYTPVFRVLNEMARPEVGLIQKDMLYSAFVHLGGQHSRLRLRSLLSLEKALWNLMEEAEPDMEGLRQLSLPRVNQRLLDEGENCSVPALERLLKTWEKDHRRLPGCAPLVDLKFERRGVFRLSVEASPERVAEVQEIRRTLSAEIVEMLMSKGRRERRRQEGAESAEGPVLVEFSESEILERVAGDFLLTQSLRGDVQGAIHAALVFLHEHQVLGLQGGKAMITQAMHIHLLEPFRRQQTRRFTRGDFEGLRIHYEERRFQIHVMREYAKFGVDKMRAHFQLILDYFRLGKDAFAERYFRGRTELFRLATSIESYRRIVDDLNHAVQKAVVGAPPDRNLLVLAGPGAGKTRVVAHRCAYLLRVERVRADQILVVCFNRAAAHELRRRIFKLVGRDAHGVIIATYHALALKILGKTLAGRRLERGGATPEFERLIPDAVKVLRGETPVAGVEPEEARERILGGISHILVDEYQDIDEKEYELISEIAGRTLKDAEEALSILAVGDDDQSIYAFKGANVEFIRRFKEDYRAEEHFLVENFRSTRRIIECANRLIGRNRDRIKTEHPIRINDARRRDPPGGRWDSLDPDAEGHVRLMEPAGVAEQALGVVAEIRRLDRLDGEGRRWGRFAVFARRREDLVPIRAALEDSGIPVQWRGGDEDRFPLFQIREIAQCLDWLRVVAPVQLSAQELRAALVELRGGRPFHRWWRLLGVISEQLEGEIGDNAVPRTAVLEFFLEALMQMDREHVNEHGVILSTAHRAKGLEFDHVLIADGGWKRKYDRREFEEERRVYYVAMTRARETLTLMRRADCQNPFVPEVEDGLRLLPVAVPPDMDLARYKDSRLAYALWGPAQVDLSFAGRLGPENPLHGCLEQLEVDDRLYPEMLRGSIYLKSSTGTRVGRLSRSAAKAWSARVPDIREIRVVALMRRTREESDPQYVKSLKCREWVVPLAEIKFGRGSESPAAVTQELF